MYGESRQVNTWAGLLIIIALSAGCYLLVAQFNTLVSGAGYAEAGSYFNPTYQFAFAVDPAWEKLLVLEKKEPDPSGEGVLRQIYFALPTEDAYNLGGYAHPLTLTLYSKVNRPNENFSRWPNYLGENANYAFFYRTWQEVPEDLANLAPPPSQVAESFYFIE